MTIIAYFIYNPAVIVVGFQEFSHVFVVCVDVMKRSDKLLVVVVVGGGGVMEHCCEAELPYIKLHIVKGAVPIEHKNRIKKTNQQIFTK